MGMRNVYKQVNNLISIENDLDSSELIEGFYFRILLLFLHKDVKLITLNPQKYSLGYEMAGHRKIKKNDTDVLLNEISNCDIELLRNINQSEEFKRGLLLLVMSDTFLEEDIIGEFLKFQRGENNKMTGFKNLMLFCNYDSSCIYLLNSNRLIDDLKPLEAD